MRVWATHEIYLKNYEKHVRVVRQGIYMLYLWDAYTGGISHNKEWI